MFYVIGIVVTFFLAAILISKHGKTGADWILTLWLMVMGIHLASFYMFVTGKNFQFPYLLGIEAPLPLLHGPFLLLYTEALTNQIAFRKYRILHFAPFLFSYLLFFQFLLLPSEQKILVYKNYGVGFETLTGFMSVMISISGVVYVGLSLWLLKKHKQTILNQFSYAEKINLAWLRYLIYGIGLIWVFVIIGNEPAIYSTVVVFVIFLGYFGINQVGIFTQKLPMELPMELKALAPIEISSSENIPAHALKIMTLSGEEEIKKAKYLKSSLTEQAAENIHALLAQYMNDKKLFVNPELTLAELAHVLQVHPNNLSQVINTFEKKTFFDYINLMRIEEFKRIVSLPENQKFTLLGLANNCGFNSKTSFNRNFKNATGLSPTDYLKQAQINLGQ